jgi:hypothetical protein
VFSEKQKVCTEQYFIMDALVRGTKETVYTNVHWTQLAKKKIFVLLISACCFMISRMLLQYFVL